MHYGDTTMKKNKESHIAWCCKQKKGIKLEEPSENLCNVYLNKAKSSLNMLTAATEKDEKDWIATTAYYARYFAFYAILQKYGIKSEIHDCTISLMKLFVEENLIEEHYYTELLLAKDLRVDTQYYVGREIDLNKLKKDSETARSFLLRMEKVIAEIEKEQINKIIEKIEEESKIK